MKGHPNCFHFGWGCFWDLQNYWWHKRGKNFPPTKPAMKVDPRGASQVKVPLLFPNCKRKARKKVVRKILNFFFYFLYVVFLLHIFLHFTVEERGNCCPKTWHGKNFFFRATLHYFFSLCKAVVLALPLTISSLFRRKRKGRKSLLANSNYLGRFSVSEKNSSTISFAWVILARNSIVKRWDFDVKVRRRAKLDYHYEICKQIFYMQQCNFMSQFCVAGS